MKEMNKLLTLKVMDLFIKVLLKKDVEDTFKDYNIYITLFMHFQL